MLQIYVVELFKQPAPIGWFVINSRFCFRIPILARDDPFFYALCFQYCNNAQ